MLFSYTCHNKAGTVSGLSCFMLMALLVFSISISPAMAQSTRDLTNRIQRLENEISTLNKAVYRGQAPAAPSFSSGNTGAGTPAAMEVRLQELETQLRTLTGHIEEQNFKIRQLETQFERLSGDVNVRLQDVESGNHTTAPGAIMAPDTTPSGGYQWNSGGSQTNNAVEVNPDLVQTTSSHDPSALYNRAFGLLKQEKYQNSEVLFQDFLTKYPEHRLSGNAIYWLGETHYVRGQYDIAARIFAEAYQKYPKSAKAPDNVLKLGMSLAGAGKREEACIALKQVNVEHADSEAVAQRAKQEMSKLGC